MPRILIVDDDPDISEVMSEVLALEGFDVSVAGNGQAALSALRGNKEHPSLILLDLMMPIMNGWDFRRAQLKDPELSSVPVVILTAAPTNDNSLSELRPDGFLRKPVELKTLLRMIATLCRQ